MLVFTVQNTTLLTPVRRVFGQRHSIAASMTSSCCAVPFCRGPELEGIRAACRVAREILDVAHAAVAPGVTTDEIDRVVRPWCADLQLLCGCMCSTLSAAWPTVFVKRLWGHPVRFVTLCSGSCV